MNRKVLICAGVPLDIRGARTGSWIGDVRDPEHGAERVMREAPTREVDVDRRAEYACGRCFAALDEPIAASEQAAAELGRVLDTYGARTAAAELFVGRTARIFEVVELGRDAHFDAELAMPGQALAAVHLHFTCGRWPLGAIRRRGCVLNGAIEAIRAAEQRTKQACAGAVVLDWFLEDGVPGAMHGLDVRVAVTAVPNLARPDRAPAFAMIVHRELLDLRELRLFEPAGGDDRS